VRGEAIPMESYASRGSERAERLAAQLRAAGIEPESWKDTIQGEAIALRTDQQKNRDDFLIPIDLFT
jgi:hypothetical protein